MRTILTIILAFFIIIISLVIIDTIFIKKFFKSSLNRINTFYDGLKSFIVINIIDRFFTTADDGESDESSD